MPQLAHVTKIYLFGRPTWLEPSHVSSLTPECAIYELAEAQVACTKSKARPQFQSGRACAMCPCACHLQQQQTPALWWLLGGFWPAMRIIILGVAR